jgi:nickel-dependent lactate racemase
MAFRQAVRWADEVFSIPIPRRYDAVITVAQFPMDVDLYQSQKAIDNAKWALKEGGTLILVSKCRDGMGDGTFARLLCRSKQKREVLELMHQEYRLGYHKAAKLAEMMCHSNLWAVTDMSPQIMEEMGLRPFRTLQSAVDELLTARPDAEILVLLDGSVTVPRVLEDE